MVRKKKQTRDEVMVEASERRAKVLAYFNGPEGEKPHRVSELMEHFDWRPDQVRQTMNMLEASKQVDVKGGGGRGNPKYFARLGAMTPARKELVPVTNGNGNGHALKKSHHKRMNGNAAADLGVELVIGGMTAIFSRNAESGRPRVVLNF